MASNKKSFQLRKYELLGIIYQNIGMYSAESQRFDFSLQSSIESTVLSFRSIENMQLIGGIED